jgi:hypothetical protein
MIKILLSLLGPALILYYVYYLEQEKCKCVMSWHHNYIKYYLLAFILAITINLEKIIKPLFDKGMATDKGMNIWLLLLLILIITNSIYLYSVYVYVGKLDKTQCGCAMHNMKYLHNTLYYVRYILIVIAIVSVLPVFSIIYKLVKNLA